jgi:Protein of unknown function (DUF2785)
MKGLDKEFWERVIADDCMLPSGYSRLALSHELLSYLGSPDPALRETLAYTVLDAWIHRDCYSPAELQEMVDTLLQDLSTGLGELSGESVFLRSFSLLILTEIIYHDLHRPSLAPENVRRVLDEALTYLAAEPDLRGYDLANGWIHAVAHAADLFFVLAQHDVIGAADLARILAAMATKVAAPVDHVYLYDEETRLVRAVMAVLQRDLLSQDDLGRWLAMLSRPEGRTAWNEGFAGAEGGPMMEAVRSIGETCARHNCRLFLYTLYFQLRSPGFAGLTLVDQAPPQASALLPLVDEALAQIRAWC